MPPVAVPAGQSIYDCEESATTMNCIVGCERHTSSAQRSGPGGRLLFLALFAMLLGCGLPARTQAPGPTKQTVRVSMGDGVELATDVYLPRDGGPFPVILLRTPYDKNGGGGIGTAAAGH